MHMGAGLIQFDILQNLLADDSQWSCEGNLCHGFYGSYS